MRSHLSLMYPGFNYWKLLHRWVEFVVGSCPCFARLLSGFKSHALRGLGGERGEGLPCRGYVSPSGVYFGLSDSERANISRQRLWFPHEVTSEKRVHKFHTNDAKLTRSGKCLWLFEANFQPIRSTTHICVVLRHQHRISALTVFIRISAQPRISAHLE